MGFRKAYTRDKGRFFAPIYYPGETYSFYLNSDIAITQPDNDLFHLNLYDGSNYLAASDIGTLIFIPYTNGVSAFTAYQIYCTFVFPDVRFGNYYFVIEQEFNGGLVEKARTNPILCEWEGIEMTSYVKYRNSHERSHFRYDKEPEFYNRFRLPLHQVNLDFESNRTQYRNVTGNRQLRNLASTLDEVVQLECREMDDLAAEAMAEVLECDEVYIDGYRVVNKSQLVMSEQGLSETRSGTFEIYTNQYDRDLEHFTEYGDVVIYAGEGILNPHIIFTSQQP